MKELFKVTYHAVIYTEQENLLQIAENLGEQLILDVDTLESIEDESELPPQWDTEYCPLVDDEGSFHDLTIEEIFNKKNKIDRNAIKTEINALKDCVKDIQERIKQLEKGL